MNKPIDPNLDCLDDFFSEAPSETAEEEKDNIFSIDNAQKKEADNIELSLNTEEKQPHHRHHHSSHSSHSSDSTHSHHSSHSHSHSSSHHSSSHHSKKEKKKKLSTSAKIAIVFIAIILILIIAIVGTIFYLENKGKNDFKNVTTETNYEEIIEHNGHKYAYNNDVVSIAFMGIDKRQLETTDKIGTAGQADANIILNVDTKTGKATALAIPRDTMVDVDLYSENGIPLRTEKMQLCLSFAYGNGKETSAQNVTTSLSRILYNIPINKYFALDLDGIAPLNDAIGGVTVTSLYDFKNLGIKVGDTVHLTGNLTEAYVRQRSLDTIDASLNRTERQVQYIKAFGAQLVPAVVNDFSVVSNLYNTAMSYSSTNIDISNVTYLASLLLSKGITDFETATVAGEMKASDNPEYADVVYAEFYPDEEALLETVLSIYYTQID